MKPLFLCLVVISMGILAMAALAGAKRIEPWVLDPCKRPGANYPGCPTNMPYKPANPYSRGCPKGARCRHG
jgi:hypothetical protein